MLRLNLPQDFWGIAHENTDLTGSLWCADQFTFRHQAEEYCERVSAAGVAADLRPVLVTMVATIASADEEADYNKKQVEFLATRKLRAAA